MSHARWAAQCFGVKLTGVPQPAPAALPLPADGTIHAVLGASGAGKSLALNALPGAVHVSPLSKQQLARPVLSLFRAGVPSATVLRLLTLVGLADARLWQLEARNLSSGERRRLEIALALQTSPALLAVDEIDAHLDADTARVIAASFSRIVATSGLRAVVSTHRPELLPHLRPARVFEINEHAVSELPPPPPEELLARLRVIPGRAGDYARFARWHYLGSGRPGPVSDVLLAMFDNRPIGIAVFAYPHLMLRARRAVLPALAPSRLSRSAAAALNAQVRLLSRIVIEPRFRGIGAAGALIAAGLARAGVPWVECIAQMGQFSGFLLRAGFVRAGEVAPPPPATRLINWLRENSLAPEALLTHELPPRVQTWLRQLSRSRIQTGHGSHRARARGLDRAGLERVVQRLHARPGYFLWSRDANV